MTALECRAVSHAYGRTPVLAGVDLTVTDGAVTALIGRSGSGKSTLLRLIAGFERLQAGEIEVAGELVSSARRHVPTHRRRIGYVPQDAALFPHLTVGGNVEFGVRRTRDRRARVANLIDLVGLTGLDGRYPHQLSGGQQQRVALARALAIEPHLILLDEPFAALDANLRTSLRRDVLAILREQGTTTVLVTHDQSEALSSADDLAFIHDGRVRQCATPAQLYGRPVDLDVATFLGEANIITGRATAEGVVTGLGTLRTALTGAVEVDVLIRPEQMRIRRVPAGGWRIDTIEYFGHDSLYHLVRVGQEGCRLLVRGEPDDALRRGDHVEVAVQGSVTTWPRRTDADVAPLRR